jgi:hypothetical protein
MDGLELRLQRLERQNRALGAALLLVCAAFLYGFTRQEALTDIVKAKRIELVDDQGVPLVTLAPSRSGGGEMTLRDGAGDRRVWLTAEKGGARFGMSGGDNATSIGFGLDPKQARLAVTGGRAFVSETVVNGVPSIEADGQDGRILFAAPYRKGM